MVSRRTLLRVAGAGAFGLAGCVAPDERVLGSDGSASATPTPTPPPTGEPTTRRPTTDSASPAADAAGVTVEGADPAWVRAFDGAVESGPVHVDGTVAVASGTRVYGLDAATGETAWTFGSPVSVDGGYGRPTANLQVHDGALYALVGIDVGTGAHDHTFHALASDGEERWRHETGVGGFHTLVGFDHDAVVLGTSDDAVGGGGRGHPVVAVNLADGSRRWTGESGDARGGAVGDGVAVVETYGAADCFDLASGDHRFRYDPGDDVDVEATAVGGGRVFVAPRGYDTGADAVALAALSPVDGSVAWDRSDRAVSSLRYRDDLYVGGTDVTRLGADGTERWSYDGGGLLTGVPFDADALYTNAGLRVVSVARADGAEQWGTDATELAIPRARGGGAVVSVDGRARTAFAHSVADGTERWRAHLPGEYPPDPAAGPDGVYLATAGGAVVKVPL